MKRILIFIVLISSVSLSYASDVKVTGEAALASSKASQLASTPGYNVSSPYATRPKEGGTSGDIVVENGSSASSCTTVRPPSGTSVSTHNVYVVGTYEDQTNHEASHTRGVAQRIYSDSGSRICAAWLHARSYNFQYQVTAYKK